MADPDQALACNPNRIMVNPVYEIYYQGGTGETIGFMTWKKLQQQNFIMII